MNCSASSLSPQKGPLKQRAKVNEVIRPRGPKTFRIPVRELVNPVKFSTCISRTGFFLVMLGLIVPWSGASAQV